MENYLSCKSAESKVVVNPQNGDFHRNFKFKGPNFNRLFRIKDLDWRTMNVCGKVKPGMIKWS